jgi:hypothetical protein
LACTGIDEAARAMMPSDDMTGQTILLDRGLGLQT